MKKVLSVLLITVIFTVGAFAGTEAFRYAEDIEDVLFDKSLVVFDATGNGPAIGINYAQKNFSISGGMHGFKLNLTGKDIKDLYMAGTIASSYRSQNFRIAALFDMRGRDGFNELGMGLGGAFYKDKVRFALPMYLTFENGETEFRVSNAYIKWRPVIGVMNYLRVRTHYNTKEAERKGGGVKNLGFDFDAQFFNKIGERFAAETLVRVMYKTDVETPAGVKASQFVGVYVEPYIFGMTEGDTLQLGIIPFATVGGDFESKVWGIKEYGLEIRTEFQPSKNLRARVSVQAYNQEGWAVKANARAAWYY